MDSASKIADAAIAMATKKPALPQSSVEDPVKTDSSAALTVNHQDADIARAR